ALGAISLVAIEDQHSATYPARLPVVQLDHIYSRGLAPVRLEIPRGRIWWRMSDHLPLIAEFEL
ncbi:MAG: endonuclease/exonuclease/phosphatase family protein, partial [Rhodoferax sp.]